MLFLLIKLLKNLILPPSSFILLLVYFTIRLHRRKQEYKFILFLTIILYVFCIPFTAKLILQPLESFYYPEYHKVDAIVVLGGGAISGTPNVNDDTGTLGAYSSNRLLTAAQLSIKYNIPIIISGGTVFKNSGNEALISKNILSNLNIDSNNIIIEDQSRNTEENAINVIKLCSLYNFKNVYLVSSSWHLPRAMYNFNTFSKSHQIRIIPFPCDYQINPYQLSYNLYDFLPQMWACESCYLAIREYLGITFKLILY